LLGAAAADMIAWENSGFSINASVRIALIDRDVPSYFQSLEHLLRYGARPPFAFERLSVTRTASGRIAWFATCSPDTRPPTGSARAAPPEAHESLISRKTVEEVPLTGLSFGREPPAGTWLQRWH